MAINPTKLLPPSSGALALRSKTTDIGKKKSGGLEGQVLVIKTQVIKIEKLISRGYTLKLKEQKEEQKELEKNKRSKKEEELEEKKPPKEGKGKIPSLPKLGFFDKIKKFIGNMILAYFAVRLIDHLPKLVPFATALGNASEFLLDVGGNLLNGLVTFIDWGYKAYDATRGFLKNLGGDNFTKVFDTFNGAVGNLIETAIIAAVTLSSFGGGADVPEPKRGFDTSGRRVSTETQKRYAQRFGKNQFAKRFGKSNLINLGERGASKSVLKFVKPFTKRLPIIGALLDFGLSVALGEDPGRAAFKAIGAGLLGAVGAAVGSLVFGFGGVIGGILGSIGGDAIGGALYDVLFGGKKPQQKNQKVQKKQGGGITRGGKAQGSISRKISGKERRRKKTRVSQKPREIEFDTPGSSVGGEEKLFGIFPNPFKKVADTFNPFKNVADAGKNLGKTDYFGPILAITSKITLGQKPTEQDYKQVGLGINLLFSEGMSKGEIVGGVAAAYADGGFVDKKSLDALMEGGDITNWVARTFKDATETNAQKTLRQIRENAGKKMSEDSNASTSPRDSEEPGSLETAGGAVAASELYKEIGANLEQWDIYRNSIALIESKGKYGIPGGSGMHYDGRYQMGRDAKIDGSRVAGVPNPGHSDDPNAHVRVSFRNNPQLQETIFTGFTIANHRYLMRNPKYKSASVERKLEILGYAHNQGMGGAENWLNTGKVGADGFGTKGTKYTDLIAKNFRAKKSGGQMELAQGAIPVPKEPTGVPLSQGKVSGIVNDRDWNTGIKLTTLKTKSGKTYQVASVLANKFSGFISDLENTGYKINVIGGYRKAGTGGGTGPSDPDYDKERYSHPYGASVDINPSRNPYGKTLITDMPSNIREIAAKHGLGWGGNWRSVKDAMHFSAMQREGGNRSWELFRKDGPAFAKSYEGGGPTLDRPHIALVGEKGREFVIDADSTAAIESTFPGFLDALNKAKYDDAINVLRNFATYEDGAQEEVIVIQNQPLQEESYQNPMVVAMGGLSGGDSYNPFEMLDRLPG